MTGSVRTIRLLVAIALAAMTGGVRAQTEVRIGVAGVAPSSGVLPEAHGWLIAPAADAAIDPGARAPARDRILLIHMPPRQASLHGGQAGIGRRSRSLDELPLGLAATGRSVYLLSENPGPGGARRSVVRSIEAVPTPVAGIWNDLPQGRMETLPPVELDGDVLGFAGTRDVLGVLARGADGLVFSRFAGGGWSETPIAAELGAGLGARPTLVASLGGFVIVGESGANGGRRVLLRSVDGTAWSRGSIDLPAGAIVAGVVGGTVVAWHAHEPRPSEEDPALSVTPVSVLLAGEGGTRPLAGLSMPAEPDFLGLTVIPDASGRLVIAVGRREGADPALRYALVEVSLSTGEILYDGPLERVAPVSPEEFKILAAAMVVMMVVSLMIVLRPVPRETEITVPDGCALASPGRRLFATLLDLVLCTLIVSRVTGVPFNEIAGLSVLLRPDQSWLTLPSVLFVGLGYSVMMETVFSATLGKLAMGCRVARAPIAGGPPARVGFGRSLVRNGVKWILPPAASLALIEPTGRHRGDLLAGAVVVVPLQDEDDASGED